MKSGPAIIMRCLLQSSFVIALLCDVSFAQGLQTASSISLQSETARKIRGKVSPVLKKYCQSACELVDVAVEVEEELGESGDLGFESVQNINSRPRLSVRDAALKIQIEDSVSASNKLRLEKILNNHLQPFAVKTSIDWQVIQVPRIGGSGGDLQSLKDQLEARLNRAVQSVIDAYCPTQCIIAQINVEGSPVSTEMSSDYPLNQIVRSNGESMKIDDVDIEVSMDSSLDASTRTQISEIIKAKTRFASPVNLNISVSKFPESYSDRMSRLAKNSDDPYGLEKLRNMLILFRELAGTKEIITNNTELSKESKSLSSSSRNLESSKVANKSVDTSEMQNFSGQDSDLEYVLYIGAALLLAGLLIALFMRVLSVGRDAKQMVQSVPGQQQTPRQDAYAHSAAAVEKAPEIIGSNTLQNGKTSIKVEALKNEIITTLIENTRVAKETFGRILKEEGVEETAKFIKILGQLVIIELLDDPNLQRDLYSLSEFYHNSQFTFSTEQELELLQALKTKVTASEIRVLTRRSLDKFDFLSKLDSEQIFNLVADESAQVQSIVLTQLDGKRRKGVFNMYQGHRKMNLMTELCKADAIPKEYLNNVALALGRKVNTRPEFDTQNLRSSEVLVDLMEKAELGEQKKLMSNLVQSNPEAAKAIKMKLVTVEMIPYMKDGHLLEIILGMERSELLAFLKGTNERIRDLLLRKAPPELAGSWVEDLNYMSVVDEASFRLAEMSILRRIRNLASNGGISIMDINDLIFSDLDGLNASTAEPGEYGNPAYNDGSMVA
ncbi:hypothetical protein N9D31_01535 [Oligoflexaceae bacterium]|nr:hypothetical protein [Oligoflexaceae bacterium]